MKKAQPRTGNCKITGNRNVTVTGLTADSRNVTSGMIFAALNGCEKNGTDYIPEALSRGASVLITESDVSSECSAQIRAESPLATFAELLHAFYNYPCRKLNLVGITGTNGKTTTAEFIKHMFQRLDHKTGVIGTLGYDTGTNRYPADNTTPGAEKICKLLAEMVRNNVDTAVMEVSSHALDQNRCASLRFDHAILTNLTRDHLDYHKTLKAYRQAKAQLFTQLKETGQRVFNMDDPFGCDLFEKYPGSSGFGFAKESTIRIENISTSIRGTRFSVRTSAGSSRFNSRIPGRHNILNITAGLCCLPDDIPLAETIPIVQNFPGARGRLEHVDAGIFDIFIDYAHTPNALENVLNVLQKVCMGRLITVFGCGGDRDRGKRPIMGEVAESLSDVLVITSDNPRSEVPERIIEDILEGVSDTSLCRIECDREKAIRRALKLADKDDIVLIAGKGHETYQITGYQKIHFDDRKVVEKHLCRN